MSTRANLIGTWELYKAHDADGDEWDYEFGEGIDLWRLEFREDGTYTATDDDWSYESNYKLEGNVLTFYEPDYPEDADVARVAKLTASELVLVYDWIGDDGKNYPETEYYKRINSDILYYCATILSNV